MIDDTIISKIRLLIQQEKFDAAHKILQPLLSQEPDNLEVLVLMAELNLEQEKYHEAQILVNNAIGIDPTYAYLFYLKSRISLEKDIYNEAESDINQAIILDPQNSDYKAFYAQIKLFRKNYSLALEIANQALELDAENVLALNVRSSALTKLNRNEESFETIQGALNENPDNPFTHANFGWNLLENNQPSKALEHFKIALQKDPNLEYAQAGMLEAIKAKNFIYRQFLKYAFWMEKLSSRYQWVFIICFYLAYRLLNKIAMKVDALKPFIVPILIIMVLFAISTWIINPISNLFLRYNKFGKYLLNKQERISSNFVAMSFLLSFIGLLLYLIYQDNNFLSILFYGFTMTIPISVLFSTKNKMAFLMYTLFLAILGVLAIYYTFSINNLINTLSIFYLIAFFVFQFFANYFIIKENNP